MGNKTIYSLGLAAAFAGCLFGSSAYAQQAIKIGGYFPPTFETTYQKFVIDGGFLKKYGYDGEFVGYSAGITAVQAATSGSVDISCESPATAIAAVEQGAQLRIVEMIDAETTFIVATTDDITKPEDLKGKNWGITRAGSISQTFAQLYMKHFGLGPDDANWIPLGGGSARALALAAKQVNATLLTISDWMKIETQPGIKQLGKLSDGVPPLPFSSCFVTADTIKNRPEMVQAFVNAAMDAARYAYTPEGKAAYIASFTENATQFTPEELEKIYDFYFNQNRFSVDPNGGMYPETLYNNMKVMVDAGTIKAQHPLSEVWDSSFMDAYIAEHGWFDYKTKQAGKVFGEIASQ